MKLILLARVVVFVATSLVSGQSVKQNDTLEQKIRSLDMAQADAVLMDTNTYEKHLKAANIARLLAPAEEDITAGRTKPARSFLKDFKRARKVSR